MRHDAVQKTRRGVTCRMSGPATGAGQRWPHFSSVPLVSLRSAFTAVSWALWIAAMCISITKTLGSKGMSPLRRIPVYSEVNWMVVASTVKDVLSQRFLDCSFGTSSLHMFPEHSRPPINLPRWTSLKIRFMLQDRTS